MKILITGCGGMLGSAMYPTMRAFGHDVRATDLVADEDWLRPLDVRDWEAVEREIETFRPDAVYHLAALTDLEYCETHPDDADATNREATANVARICAARGILLVYISTAGVFDGTKPTPYDEWDTPAPLMAYGQTKLQGEQAVRAENGRYYVVRAGWMFGGERKDHKFVSKIAAQLRNGATEIRAVDDKVGTVTFTRDFAANLQTLIESDRYGTYHMVCEGPCSRFDVAKEIVDVLGYGNVPVTRVSSDYFDAEYFAPRPRSEMLVNRALKEAGLNRMRPWREALRDYLMTSDGLGERARVATRAAVEGRSQPN